MGNIKEGDSIGIFIVLRENEKRANDGHRLYDVRCKYCGREFSRTLTDIKKPSICQHVGKNGYKEYKRAKVSKLRPVHRNMISRCENEKDKSYRHYGAKGIRVCDAWKDYFSFEEWAIRTGYKDGLTIDRIDSNGNYTPENCRWISLEENARFKSTTNVINVDGVIMSGKQWAKELKVGTNFINRYIKKHGIEETIVYIRRCIIG